ncbi:MAG: hypothetical protein NTU76_03580 [Candidatus Taylorbacteria bacterium]|nr:hypothetical protein [Candidatus Taylorbacteria bacterium]
MKKDKDKYVRTTNLNVAVFLFTNNQQISGINPINNEQKEFAFIKTDYLEELIYLYKFANKDDERLLVPVHKYEQARRELLERLRD